LIILYNKDAKKGGNNHHTSR